MSKKLDLTGQRFGRLIALTSTIKNKHGSYFWLCKCDCGNEITTLGSSLVSGLTKSCGCLARDVGIQNLVNFKKKYFTEEEILLAKKARKSRDNQKRRDMGKDVENTLTGSDIEFLFLLQDKKCVCCGKDISDGKYHIDHIIPLSKGFGLTLNNIQLLCPTCNLKKSSKAIDYLGLYIRTGKYFCQF